MAADDIKAAQRRKSYQEFRFDVTCVSLRSLPSRPLPPDRIWGCLSPSRVACGVAISFWIFFGVGGLDRFQLNAATELGLLIVTSFEENGREVDDTRLSQLKRVATAMTPGVEMSEFLKRAIRCVRPACGSGGGGDGCMSLFGRS